MDDDKTDQSELTKKPRKRVGCLLILMEAVLLLFVLWLYAVVTRFLLAENPTVKDVSHLVYPASLLIWLLIMIVRVRGLTLSKPKFIGASLMFVSVAVFLGWDVLQGQELSKEEIRHLLGAVQLPEALNPEAMHTQFSSDTGSFSLNVCIRVKGAQADELLKTWLQGASREYDGAAGDIKMIWEHHSCHDSSLSFAVQDDDILAFKKIGEYTDVGFVLRKRDAGVDIHCFAWNASWQNFSEKVLYALRKYRGYRLGPGDGGERHMGTFGPD